MPFGLSPVHVLAALVIALIVIGPRRLPNLGQSAGRFLREFREGADQAKDLFVAEISRPSLEPSDRAEPHAADPHE
jgi:TatA/E family protein of Tat protein translocase